MMGTGPEAPESLACLICRHGTLRLGTATVTLTKDELTLVVKDVPALVCGTCGEEYVDDATTSQLLNTAREAAKAGVQVDVRSYIVA